jgi:hypothetical protein
MVRNESGAEVTLMVSRNLFQRREKVPKAPRTKDIPPHHAEVASKAAD